MHARSVLIILGLATYACAAPLNINLGAYSPALVVGDGAISFAGEEQPAPIAGVGGGEGAAAAGGEGGAAAGGEGAAAAPGQVATPAEAAVPTTDETVLGGGSLEAAQPTFATAVSQPKLLGE